MDRTDQQYTISAGTDVVGSNGEKVGQVVAAHPSYIVVEKGFFFPTDYYIPTSAITTYDGDKVYLGVTKEEALNQGWDVVPAEPAYTETTGVAPVAPATTDTYAADVDRDVATEVTDRDSVRVPLHEEELTATKRDRQIGEVAIDKDVVTEEKVMEVPVTEERVRVERHAVDRDATGDTDAFKEGTIEVPIRGEDVEVQKRARVAEEVEIEKEAVQRTEEVAGTVRHEEVRIDEEDARGSTRG
ncbi:MAG TPA: DUF2382 domain-containing protein [Thermomicrobiales bacterium]|nr:DUF2382 domain-containing protein [Thermomicrobiales bacterium]